MRAQLTLSLLIGILLLVSDINTVSADFEQVLPATHIFNTDGAGNYDYNQSIVDVAVNVTLDNSIGGQWISSPTGATDWAEFIEAGWIQFAAGSSFADDFPNCVSKPCPYSTSGTTRFFGLSEHRDIIVDSTTQFNPGMSPWFKVEKDKDSEKWRAMYSYNGPWKELHSKKFGSSNFAWIVTGIETLSTGTYGASINAPGIRHQFNMYSKTSFGNRLDWPGCCTSQVRPWCYSHIETTFSCPLCGITMPPGQSSSAVSSCNTGSNCNNSWVTFTP